MMLSLAVNGEITEHRGEGLVRRWAGDLDWFLPRAKRIPGLRVLEHPMLDRTKIDLDMSRRGLNGQQLAAELERRGIVCEMASGNFVMCLSGIGSERRDYERLQAIRREILLESPSPDGTPHSGIGSPTEGKALRMYAIGQECDAVERALAAVPAEYRRGILANICRRAPYPSDAGSETYGRWRRKFLYQVAKNLHLI